MNSIVNLLMVQWLLCGIGVVLWNFKFNFKDHAGRISNLQRYA